MRVHLGTASLGALAQADLALCAALNRVERRAIVRLLVVCSRLADGVVWYTLAPLLPLVYGLGEWRHVLRLAAAGTAGALLYKLIKRSAARPRPFVAHEGITPRTLPLDLYAFPSGHTLHAVAFTLLLTAEHPELGPALVPFTILVAVSRVALGLHYPSDVVAGAGLGALVALVALGF